ncbi:PilN domain-containing protein [Salinimonas sp. HHU 13199]|uniref:PilN domain-containing protein n=1 Tax=Salinimonas profundi TaxID=2729140 RepID=A0ABR8LPG9_9ALTE|nr:PilN domain-containing protein [Salinimonas profundi]MBD3586826.1 PilN domain-containing protein [Salinimonas profundi]
MAHVNLLPWREQQRQLQKKNYLGFLALVALTIGLIFWVAGQTIEQQTQHQNARNTFLTQEIAKLDAQITEIQKIKEKKSAIEQRMALIGQLQVSRNVAPRVFHELAQIVPPGVSFKTMQRSGNSITIEGISESNNRLSDFMRRIENSEVFSHGDLSSIIADTSAADAVSGFTLTFQISPDVAPVPADTTAKKS